MCSSFSIPPVDRPRAPARPSRGARRAVLWALLAVWCCLIAFALVSLANPPWLRELSSGGKKTEARVHADAGDQAARHGNWQGAIEWYDRALRVDPSFLPARINRAIAYGKAGLAERGLASLREALEGNSPGRGTILYNIAELHRQQGNFAEAVSRYKEALAAGAPPELVYGRLGDAYMEMGTLGEAHAALQAALDAREDPVTAYRQAFIEVREDEDLDSLQRGALEEVLSREHTPHDLDRYDLELVRDQAARDPERARLLDRLGRLESTLGEGTAARGS